jgi:hypothetical protein
MSMSSQMKNSDSEDAQRTRNRPRLDVNWGASWCRGGDDLRDGIWQFGNEATDWLSERTGINMTPRLFARMRDLGMGPYLVGTAVAELSVMCNWASFVFDIPQEGPPPLDSNRVFEPIRSRKTRSADWLVAAEDGPQADDLVQTMEDLGANIVRARSPLEAAQVVSALQLHGMIMCFNRRVEAEFVIAYVCMEEAIPFIMITHGPERPASMAGGGVVLHNPRSPYEVIAALESLPSARLVGLKLPYDGVVAEKG